MLPCGRPPVGASTTGGCHSLLVHATQNVVHTVELAIPTGWCPIVLVDAGPTPSVCICAKEQHGGVVASFRQVVADHVEEDHSFVNLFLVPPIPQRGLLQFIHLLWKLEKDVMSVILLEA